MNEINTKSERSFAIDIGYLSGIGEEIRLHLCNMADAIDELQQQLLTERARVAVLVHAAQVSRRWEQDEIDKVKARVRTALEDVK